jgi:hypothetical protein
MFSVTLHIAAAIAVTFVQPPTISNWRSQPYEQLVLCNGYTVSHSIHLRGNQAIAMDRAALTYQAQRNTLGETLGLTTDDHRADRRWFRNLARNMTETERREEAIACYLQLHPESSLFDASNDPGPMPATPDEITRCAAAVTQYRMHIVGPTEPRSKKAGQLWGTWLTRVQLRSQIEDLELPRTFGSYDREYLEMGYNQSDSLIEMGESCIARMDEIMETSIPE